MMYYVYRFLDKKKNIIYVGKSKQDLEQRFRSHTHLPDACYDLTYKIEYIECKTESDMAIKEIYYINKYRHNGTFFNVLDTADVPVSVEFTDKWKQYRGLLNSKFPHSLNYLKGYSTVQPTRYNKDGSIDRRKSNSQKGMSTYVESLTIDEVNSIINHYIDQLNNAENDNQEQIRFRNLVMFMLSINLPLKLSELITFRYSDLFDEFDVPHSISYQLGRFSKDVTISIPLNKPVRDLLVAYTQKYNLNYSRNADDPLFLSRKHQVLSQHACWKIISDAAVTVGIDKNIGTESTRKTYGMNIYNRASDKLNAILFLSEIWGQMRDATIIRYLDLANNAINFDYYFGDTFSLGTIDLSKIKCLDVRCS